MKTPALLGGLILGIVAAGGPVQGQAGQPAVPAQPAAPPPITFRAEINYVEVDARVLDAQGKFIPGLSPADFQVLEDGKPQQVTAFSLVNLPVERMERPLFASRPIEPDVRNNLQAADGRIYLIVLDDLHTNPLRSNRTKAAAQIALLEHCPRII